MSLPSADPALMPGLYAPSVQQEYRIQVGDVVALRSYYDAELNQEVSVRPDGRISLLFMGDVYVVGMTPSQLDAVVTKAYAQVVDFPDVTINIRASAVARVYVGGQVRAPAMQPFSGLLTVAQATIAAGGFAPAANRKQVVVVRRQEDGALEAFTVDVAAVLAGETPDVYLAGSDVVYVPRTPIGDVAEFVHEYVDQIIPNSVAFVFGWVRESSGSGSVLVTP